MSDFDAHVQYDDFKGTVAADRSDTNDIIDFLRNKGLATANQRVVGFNIGFGGNHGHAMEKPGIVAYLQEGSFDEPKPVLLAVDIDITTAEFFAFFKRFSLVMLQKGMNTDGVKVEGPYYDE